MQLMEGSGERAPAEAGGMSTRALGVMAVILAAAALVVNLVIPGPAGNVGADGMDGGDGAAGTNGVDSWDLNGNGTPDIGTEDANRDGSVNRADCAGPQGPGGINGADGIDCWDLNGNGIGDVAAEDLNGDLTVDMLDCRGAQGPQGFPGTPGGGTILASRGALSGWPLSQPCAYYQGAEVTMTVPGPGTVVVTAMVTIRIDHTSGNTDGIDLYLDVIADWCAGDGWGGGAFVDPSEPTAFYYEHVPLLEPFTVTAGTYTFYINGTGFAAGGIGDSFWLASVVAVFYPA